VFDWAWARAYEQAGLSYYPKLVSAIPFTPAPSRRLLLADRTDEAAARALVDGAITLAGRTECSSLHVLFPLDDELPLFRKAGWGPLLHPNGKRPDVTGAASAKPGFVFDD
jgi:predicted N-acyltransferase